MCSCAHAHSCSLVFIFYVTCVMWLVTFKGRLASAVKHGGPAAIGGGQFQPEADPPLAEVERVVLK